MRFVIPLLLAAQYASAATQSPVEKELRDRVGKFYSLLVAKQFRESEAFVASGDRDIYYAMEKPLMYDFEIRNLKFDATGSVATLDMESTTKIRRPLIGEIKIPLSYLSHWRLENGTWFWFIPNEETRDTPFGKMTYTKRGIGQESDDTIKKKIAEAPSPEAVLTAVKVSGNAMTLGQKPGDLAVLSFKNTLPGRVKLHVEFKKNPAFIVQLWPLELGEGDHATMLVKRVALGTLEPTQISVNVEPTQQKIAIQVK